MAKCKKCGAELIKTNKVLSVIENSEASKILSKGDVIVFIDEKSVKNFSDIEKIISENKACKISILHNEQTKNVSIESPIDYLKSIEFEADNVCPKCGAKQKGNYLPLLIAIFFIILSLGLVFVYVFSNRKQQTATIDIGDNSADFTTSEVIGRDNIDSMTNSELVLDLNGNKISITSSGSLTPTEKADNINNFNQKLNNQDNSCYFLNFDDSEPVFATEKVGSDSYRKMYVKNSNFDVRKPIISGYTLSSLSQDKLVDIGKNKKEILGTVYFDYGYANWPKNATLKTRKTTLGKIEFNEIRYVETITALRNLLSEIPQSVMNSTVFYVDGHTDHTSPHDFNQALSEARAECVKEILVKSFGIKPKNIITKGYSWDRLVVNTLEECAENRRVEISVLFFN